MVLKNKTRIKFKTLVLLFFLCVLQINLISKAEDNPDNSIVGDFFSKVFDIELNDGSTMLDTEKDIKYREQINTDIYKGESAISYSLYDRFGGNIKFIPYYGETRISTGLLDRFYTKLIVNDDEFKLTVREIKDLLSKRNSSISNNMMYKNRPNILKTEDVESGSRDPRVYAYEAISYRGGEAYLGNLYLGFAENITIFISWLSGSSIFNTLNNIWEIVCENSIKGILKFLRDLFLPLVLIVFVISLISRGIRIYKGNIGDSFAKLLKDLVSMLCSLGLIYTLINNPTIFSKGIYKLVTTVDYYLDSALADGEDEVISSDIQDNIRTAYLWKITCLEPWCEGMFGDKYENLYTQYDTDKSHNKLYQDNDDVVNYWDDGSVKYNSASLTGDITIPLGNGKEIRNWAALAWSTQSIYHIESIRNSEDEIYNYWPNAYTTPMNSSIYKDNFRWLDATLNISPEYRCSGDRVYSTLNYTNSRLYKSDFKSKGKRALYLSLLLIPIGILAIRKLYQIVLLIVIGVRLCYYSFLNFVMSDDYDIFSNIKKAIKPIYDFLWWSLVIFVAMLMFSTFVGKSLISDIIWIIIGIYLNKYKPIRTPSEFKRVFNNAKNKISSKVKNGVEKLQIKLSK